MKQKIMFAVMLVAMAGWLMSARCGNLNPPAGPESANSAIWTLDDIYHKLDTRAAVSIRTNAFTGPVAAPTSGTMHTLDEIMTLATNRAAVSRTGQTPTLPYAAPAGSDGNLQVGVAWPNPRFSPVAASGAETNQIRDNLTGLIWAQNANFAGAKVNWQAALDYIAATNASAAGYGGTNDWRLPNVLELLSLLAYQYNTPMLTDGTGTQKWTEALGPFTGVDGSWQSVYWTSTVGAADPANNALYMNLWPGGLNSYNKVTQSGYVWPVRGGK